MPDPVGVLLMAYGTPDTLDDVEAYYTHIRHGRKPPPELLEELRERYALVGGHTPLSEISEETGGRLEERLRAAGGEWTVVLGMKHWQPWIRDAVQALAEGGVKRAVGLVLAPHYSTMSIAEYERYVSEAQADLGTAMDIRVIKSWHLHPGYLDAVAGRVSRKLQDFSEPGDVHVIFTAHSLPERIVQHNDPYPAQLLETAQALAAKLKLQHWSFAYQSAGRTAEPWLAPDLLEAIDDLADRGVRNILVAPIGFVSDHLEILYDIDHEAQEKARERGVSLQRTDSLNASPDFIEVLADLVLTQAPSR